MRICVLQSSYESTSSVLEGVDDVPSQPGALSDQHTFENRFITKAAAKQEIDAIVAEGFDFFFNFLWGTLDDPVAGALESQYFESLGLPSCGVRSWERLASKNDFYQKARSLGAPPVPGTANFPLFVKPANGCASQMIDEKSVCHNEEELHDALQRINGKLHEARLRRAEALGIKDKEAYANRYDQVGRDSDDVVIQEYIDGQDYTCSVIKMGDGCLALAPFRYKMPSAEDKFLTFDLKFHERTRIELLSKKDDPVVFERIQRVAIEAYVASECSGSNMGCDVDLRVRPDGAVFAIEINPQPAAFIPEGKFQDLPIIHSLPGAHRAVINIFLANHLLSGKTLAEVADKVSLAYDEMAPSYNKLTEEQSNAPNGMKSVVDAFDFNGTVLELACGTGNFGRALSAAKSWTDSRETNQLVGFDISPGMLAICKDTGQYDATYREPMEAALVNFPRYAETIDHIVCFSALQFLRPETFHFVLVLCFALANRSVTVSIDEIPDKYNETVADIGLGYMRQYNHRENMESFGEPPGWKLKHSRREYSWTSPKTGVRVYTTYLRYERVVPGYRDLMFSNEELPN